MVAGYGSGLWLWFGFEFEGGRYYYHGGKQCGAKDDMDRRMRGTPRYVDI